MAYDKKTDYSILMANYEKMGNDAVKAGNTQAANQYYRQAAEAEQLRNQKIQGEGLNYATSNRFGSYLTQPDTPKAPAVTPAPGSGAAPGTGTGGSTVPAAPKTSEEVYERMKNFGEFSYDPAKDLRYQQDRKQAQQLGRTAMEDTVAQVSARTGGMASSYAGTVGQQAYNRYLETLQGNLPEYEQAAYERYRAEKGDLENQYAVEKDREDEAEAKAQADRAEKYETALNLIASGMMPDGAALQAMLDRGFTPQQVQAMADKAAKEADAERQKGLYNTALTLIENGIMPEGETLQAMLNQGFTAEQIRKILESLNGGSGGSGNGGGGPKQKPKEEQEDLLEDSIPGKLEPNRQFEPGPTAKNILVHMNQAGDGGYQGVIAQVESALRNGSLTDAEADYILFRLGNEVK